MSSPTFNPNSLTKDKLKRELQENNVDFPSDAKKDVYVQLYKKYVLTENKLEFSSDEESPQKSQGRKKKPGTPTRKGTPKKNSKSSNVMDVTQLTDQELVDKLREHNIDCGPILDSTRRVYQRKLEKVLAGEVKAEAHQNSVKEVRQTTITTTREEFSDSDETEVKEIIPTKYKKQARATPATAVVQEKPVTPTRGQTRSFESTPVRRQTRTVQENTSREFDIRKPEKENANHTVTSTTTTSTRSSTTVTTDKKTDEQQTTPAPSRTRRVLTIWAQITILIVAAILIFLFIQKMEPSKNTIQEIDNV